MKIHFVLPGIDGVTDLGYTGYPDDWDELLDIIEELEEEED